MIPVHFDMETMDPDDILTLMFLIDHPKMKLTSVTVTPGRHDQVKLIDFILHKCNVDPLTIELGYGGRKYEKTAVGKTYYKVYPELENWETKYAWYENYVGAIYRVHKKHPDLQILTGAPLTNIAQYMKSTNLRLKRWVAQGGFAGDNIVAPENRLEKFNGKETCRTYNFGGDIKAAQYLLSCDKIDSIRCVSKNVCHGVKYDEDLHERLRYVYQGLNDIGPGLKGIYEFLDERYAKRGKLGKALHDILAAAAICHDVCTYAPVDLYCEKGQWGSKPNPESHVEISTAVDLEAFKRILTWDSMEVSV